MQFYLPLILAGFALVFGNGCGSETVPDQGGGSAGGDAGGSTGSQGGDVVSAADGVLGAGGTTGAGGSTGGHGALGAGSGDGKGSADGGSAGSSGTGGVSCTDLENQYGNFLPAAKACDANTEWCQQLVSSSLSPCFVNCMTYVNDSSTLNFIKASWKDAGCDSLVGVVCPAIACIPPTNNICVVGDGGDGVCSSNSGATAN